nr:MAG TPA_asm: hypothetical protein [Caudoviricetes sp.]
MRASSVIICNCGNRRPQDKALLALAAILLSLSASSLNRSGEAFVVFGL